MILGMAKDRIRPPDWQISVQATHEMLRLIAETDEFKGRWEALQALSPERLRSLRNWNANASSRNRCRRCQ